MRDIAVACALVLVSGCVPDTSSVETGSETETRGDGDGDTNTGDGDGDGDTGDGDGDTGDGDGDIGDGDGDETGDGDGDETGDGDGDGDPGEEQPPPIVYDCDDGTLPWSGALCGLGHPCGELQIAPIRNQTEFRVSPQLAISSDCTLHLRYDEDEVDYYSVNTGEGWSAEQLEFELAWSSGDLFVDPETHVPTLIGRDGENNLEVRARVDAQWQLRATKPHASGYRSAARGLDGTLHAAYNIPDEGLHYGRLAPDAEAWETVELLHPFASKARVAVSLTGAVHLLWRYTIDEEETVYVEWKTPLEPLELVTTDDVYGGISVPRMTFVEGQPPDPLGRMYLQYSRSYDAGGGGAYVAVRTAPNVYEQTLLATHEDIPSMPDAQQPGEIFVREWPSTRSRRLISNGQDLRMVWIAGHERFTYETVCEGEPAECDWEFQSDDSTFELMIGELVDGELIAKPLGELPRVDLASEPRLDQTGRLHWIVLTRPDGYTGEYLPYTRTLEHIIVDLDP